MDRFYLILWCHFAMGPWSGHTPPYSTIQEERGKFLPSDLDDFAIHCRWSV